MDVVMRAAAIEGVMSKETRTEMVGGKITPTTERLISEYRAITGDSVSTAISDLLTLVLQGEGALGPKALTVKTALDAIGAPWKSSN